MQLEFVEISLMGNQGEKQRSVALSSNRISWWSFAYQHLAPPTARRSHPELFSAQLHPKHQSLVAGMVVLEGLACFELKTTAAQQVLTGESCSKVSISYNSS